MLPTCGKYVSDGVVLVDAVGEQGQHGGVDSLTREPGIKTKHRVKSMLTQPLRTSYFSKSGALLLKRFKYYTRLCIIKMYNANKVLTTSENKIRR